MRIRTLIQKLEAVARQHGNVHITALNRDGDHGTPVIRDTTIFKSGNTRPTVRWEVVAERGER